MCPAAQARMPSPRIEITAPISKARGVGRAKIMKTAANKKPSGTLQRCIHVPPRRMFMFSILYSACQRQHTAGCDTNSGSDGVQNAFDVNVHADPFRTRFAVTIHSAINVGA